MFDTRINDGWVDGSRGGHACVFISTSKTAMLDAEPVNWFAAAAVFGHNQREHAQRQAVKTCRRSKQQELDEVA